MYRKFFEGVKSKSMTNGVFTITIGILVSLWLFRLSWWFTNKNNIVYHTPIDIVVGRRLARKCLFLFSVLKHFLKDNWVLQFVSFAFLLAFVSWAQYL